MALVLGGIFLVVSLAMLLGVVLLPQHEASQIGDEDEDRIPRPLLMGIVVVFIALFTVGRFVNIETDHGPRPFAFTAPAFAGIAIFLTQLFRSGRPRAAGDRREARVASAYRWTLTLSFFALCALLAHDLWRLDTTPPPYRFFLPGFAVLLFAFYRLSLVHRAIMRGSAQQEFRPPTRSS